MTEKYRPSNGSEGCMFEEQFCDICKKEDVEAEEYCMIHNSALLFDLKDKNYPEEWCYSENGKPTCTAFVAR